MTQYPASTTLRNPDMPRILSKSEMYLTMGGGPETLLSVLGGACVGLLSIAVSAGIDAAGAGGVGISGDNAAPDAMYVIIAIVTGVLAAGISFLYMGGASLIWKPLEFSNRDKKQAYEDYHELSLDDQSRIANVYRLFMETPPDEHKLLTQRRDMFNDARYKVLERNRLEKKRVATDYSQQYEDAAKLELEAVTSEVEELHKTIESGI